MEKIVNLQANGKAVDLTPPAVGNWRQHAGAAPVLIVNPVATLHQRTALAWVTASDTLNILESSHAAHGNDPGNDRAMLSVAIERVHQLERMLSDIAKRTAVLEGGAA